jgi:DNA-directed RNA polymerase specialized sigma24 family protein
MDDSQATEAVLSGDREAYGHLMRRYHRRLYYYVIAKVADDGEAEDLVQRTFVTAFHKLASWDPSLPLIAWLRRSSRTASWTSAASKCRPVGSTSRRRSRNTACLL